MKRCLRTIALFALIGFSITTILAWMFAALGAVGKPDVNFQRQPSLLQWSASVPQDWPSPTWQLSTTTRGLDWKMSLATQGDARDPIPNKPETLYQLTALHAGWPFRALQWRDGFAHNKANGQVDTWGRYWIPLPDWIERAMSSRTNFPGRRRLPIEPLWPGLFANTALFGGGIWLLLRGRSTLKRLVRSKRGQCLNCGYDLRGAHHTACPECGSSLASTTHALSPD